MRLNETVEKHDIGSLRANRTLLLYFSLQFFSEGKLIKSPSAFSSAIIHLLAPC